MGEVTVHPVTSSESFFPAALLSLAPLVLDFDARMAVECISFGRRPDPGFVSSNFAPKPQSCRSSSVSNLFFFAILGLEPAEQDGQETDNFTDEIQHECLVM